MNKLYKTNGYRITKIRGELGLRKIYPSSIKTENIEKNPEKEVPKTNTEKESEESDSNEMTLADVSAQLTQLINSFNGLLKHLDSIGIFKKTKQKQVEDEWEAPIIC